MLSILPYLKQKTKDRDCLWPSIRFHPQFQFQLLDFQTEFPQHGY